MSMPYTLLNEKFSEEGVGLCEELGLQPISEVQEAITGQLKCINGPI